MVVSGLVGLTSTFLALALDQADVKYPVLVYVFGGLAGISGVALLTAVFGLFRGRLWAWIKRIQRYLWIVGSPIAFGALLGGIGWLTYDPLYGVFIGLAAFGLAQAACALWFFGKYEKLQEAQRTLLRQVTASRPKGSAARGTLTHHEPPTKEKQLEEENKRLRGERDAQHRQRCLDVADDLQYLLESNAQQDPEEIMRKYEEHLKGRVDHLRAGLKTFGWWKPQESEKEKLENPTNPDDLRNLDGYIRNSCGHGFW